jgi:hypothetical protein
VEVSGSLEAMRELAGAGTNGCAAPSAPGLPSGGGEVGGLMRALDWTTSPLGPPGTWAQPLRAITDVMLGSKQPMFAAWGPARAMLYNDVFCNRALPVKRLCPNRQPIRHGQAVGRSGPCRSLAAGSCSRLVPTGLSASVRGRHAGRHTIAFR